MGNSAPRRGVCLLSLLVPGLGHLLLRRWVSGVVFVVLGLATLLAFLEYGGLFRYAFLTVVLAAVLHCSLGPFRAGE